MDARTVNFPDMVTAAQRIRGTKVPSMHCSSIVKLAGKIDLLATARTACHATNYYAFVPILNRSTHFRGLPIYLSAPKVCTEDSMHDNRNKCCSDLGEVGLI